jgi:hypothetical protein
LPVGKKLHAGDHQGPVFDGLLRGKNPLGEIFFGTCRIWLKETKLPTTLHLGDHLGNKAEKPHHLIPLPSENGRTPIKFCEFLKKGKGRFLKKEMGLIRWNVQILPGDRAVMEAPPKKKRTIHGRQDEGFHGPMK